VPVVGQGLRDHVMAKNTEKCGASAHTPLQSAAAETSPVTVKALLHTLQNPPRKDVVEGTHTYYVEIVAMEQ